MAVKKSKRTQAKGKSRTIKHSRIPKRVKIEAETNMNRCLGCGFPVHESEKFCGECMCEDDCGY